MSALIDNLINGNLSNARKQAKRFPAWEIRAALIENVGYSPKKATLISDWLKGRDCWQEACDCP